MAVSIDFAGKKGVVFGVANQRSIAWAISERLIEAGAELAFTYLNDRLLAPVAKTVAALDDPLLIECDATDDGDVQSVYDQVGEKWGSIDFVVHFRRIRRTRRPRRRLLNNRTSRIPNRTRNLRIHPHARRITRRTPHARRRRSTHNDLRRVPTCLPRIQHHGHRKSRTRKRSPTTRRRIRRTKHPSQRNLRWTATNPSRKINPRLPRHDTRTP